MKKSIDNSDLHFEYDEKFKLDENKYLSKLNKRLNEMGYDNVDNIDDAHKYIFPNEYNWVLEEINRVKQQENLPPMRTGDHVRDLSLYRRLNKRKYHYPYIVNHAAVYGSNSDSYHDIILEPIRQELILLNKQIEIGNSEFTDKEYLPQDSIVKAQAVLDEINQRKSEKITLEQEKSNSKSNLSKLPSDKSHENLVKDFLGGSTHHMQRAEELFYQEETLGKSMEYRYYEDQLYLDELNQMITSRGKEPVNSIDEAHKIIFPYSYGRIKLVTDVLRNLENWPFNPEPTEDEPFQPGLPLGLRTTRHQDFPNLVSHALRHKEKSSYYTEFIINPLMMELDKLNQQLPPEERQYTIIKAKRKIKEKRTSERVAVASLKYAETKDFDSDAASQVLASKDTNRNIGEFLGGATNVDNDIYFKKYKKYKRKYLNLKTRK